MNEKNSKILNKYKRKQGITKKGKLYVETSTLEQAKSKAERLRLNGYIVSRVGKKVYIR